jgi:hypothetical protein
VRTGAIALTGLLGLVAVFLFVSYPQFLLLLAGAMVSLLLILGLLVFPFFKSQIPVVVKPIERPDDGFEKAEARVEEPPIWEGKPFPVSELTQRLTVSIHLKNLPMLLATGIIALATFSVGLQVGIATQMNLSSTRYFEVYALGYCSVFFLGIAGLWLSERALLRNAGVAFGAVQRPLEGRLTGRSVGYHFKDRGGHYHGGTKLFLGKYPGDNIVLVLFNQANPDLSMPSWGFIFHRIELTVSR